VTGKTLAEVVRSEKKSIVWIIDIAIQLCQGAGEAHRAGIIHRDIKSANVLVDDSGRVRILDFGLAAVSGAEELTMAGSALGTVSYMSPEQAAGRDIDKRSDLFSIGIVFYELLTGKTPFKQNNDAATLNAIINDPAPDVSIVRSDTPEPLQRIIAKLLEKDPNRRYQSAEGILADILTLKENSQDRSSDSISTGLETKSIAVLPFDDLSQDKDQEYLCQGVAEEISAALAKVDQLRVAARISTLNFQEKGENVADIGRRLGVRTLLHGSVRKAGNRLRISVQLVNVADGYQTWSDRYDREMEDIFEIEDDISRSVVEHLQLSLNPREERLIGKVMTQHVEAYELYLRGHQFLKLSGKKNSRFAIQLFNQAIKIDPDFAAAYAAMSLAYANLYMYLDPAENNLRMMLKYSNYALDRAPDLVDSHVARALALTFTPEADKATWEFELAIKLDPKSWKAHYHFARHCWMTGDFDRSVIMFKRAIEIQPEDYQSPVLLANVYKKLGRPKEIKKMLEYGIRAAKQRLTLNPDEVRAIYLCAASLAELDQEEEALEMVDQALKIEPNDPGVLYNLACTYSGLGKVDEAITMLEASFDNGFVNKSWLVNDSSLDPIRSDPRYQELLKKFR